jgi:hypothetical protein
MKPMIKRFAEQLGIEEVTPIMMIGIIVLIIIPFPTITLAALILLTRRFLKK